MRTTKPISTISFNSTAFLKTKLDELYKSGVLSFYCFITHKPEDDEGGKKEHAHVYIEPSRMVQTDDIKNELKEFVPSMPDKPLGVLPFVSSKWDSWYMYALHDKRYLASKGQSRKFHYVHDNFITSDSDNLLFKARSIDLISLSPYADMEEAIRSGIDWSSYFSRGTVPLPQISQFAKAWELLTINIVYRNGKNGHPNVDEKGELTGIIENNNKLNNKECN